MTVTESDERRVVRRTRLRGGAALLTGPLLAGAVLAATTAGAPALDALPLLRSVVGAAPLLVAAGAVGVFAALPAVRRGVVVARAGLTPRRPWATAPRPWSSVVGGAALLLAVLAVLAAGTQPDRPDATGFVRWRPSFAGALMSGFPDPGESAAVVVSLVGLLAVTWAALVRLARTPAVPEAEEPVERARALGGRAVLATSGGGVLLLLSVALLRIGGSAWAWGTAPDLAGAWADPALAAVGAGVIGVGAGVLVLAVGAWFATVVLVVRMARSGARTS